MKRILCILILLSSACVADAKRFLFFLHGKFVELEGVNGVHPEYGKVEYHDILEAFRKKGFVVISDVRPKNADAMVYARKTARQVDSLIKKGVKSSDITVVGTSKGGYIAQYVSEILKNGEVNFVFVGSCGDYLDNEPDIKWFGNVLSIYEKTDEWRSCEKMKNRQGNKITHYQEIELHTGTKHGYLYKAIPAWMDPAVKWAKQQYK